MNTIPTEIYLMVLLQVLQKSYFNQSFINDEFVIDDTLGRDVKFAIDVLSGMPTGVSIFYSNGTLLFNRNGGITDRTFVNLFPILKVYANELILNTVLYFTFFLVLFSQTLIDLKLECLKLSNMH